MRNSKALKGWSPKKLYEWWIMSKLSDYYDNVVRWIKRPFWKAKLMYDWYKNVFHDDFDWDSGYLYKIMEYKLKRIKISLENGCAIQEEKDMQALNLAIEILRRIQEEHKYCFEKAYRDHNLKWGEMITWHTPNYDEDGEVRTYTWNSRRPNANTPELEEQERAEIRLVWEKEEWLYKRYQKWFYGILEKYMKTWWD